MAQVPGTPVIQPRPTATNQTLEFWWNPPVSDGGSPITSYILTDGTNTFNLDSNARYYRAQGLANGTIYPFTIAASNAIGSGAPVAFRAVQPGLKPDPPLNLTYSSINTSNTDYLITWTNPTNVGQATLNRVFLQAYPVDGNGVPITTSTNLIVKRTMFGGAAGETQSRIVPLISGYNYKVLVQTINDPGYSLPTAYTSTITLVSTVITAFSPSSFTGMQLWLDAADSSSYVTSGTDVIRWSSKGPSSIILSSIAGKSNGTYPLLAGSTLAGNTTLTFTSTSLLKQGTAYDNVKNMFWVGYQANQGTQFPFLFGADSTFDWHANNGPMQYIGTGSASAALLFASTFFLGNNSNFSNNFSNIPFASTNTSFMLSVYSISGGSSRWQGLTFDRTGSRGWMGNLGEVITYSNEITANQRLTVEGYLAWKWGLSTLLPRTHPFYTRAPIISDSNIDFSPSTISTLRIWLDANDAATISRSGSTSTITSWADKSGSSNSATPGGTAPTYVPASNAVSFGGAGYMTTNFLASYSRETTCLVFNANNITGFQQLFASQPGGRQVFFGTSPNGSLYVKNTMGGGVITPPSFAISASIPTVLTYHNDGTSTILYINGSNVAAGTTISYTAGSTILGAYYSGSAFGDYYNGLMYEFNGYSTFLNLQQRQQAEGYLAWKWGIQSRLPSTHLYFFRPPTRKDTFTSFSPSSISGIQIWLDAKDSTTFTFSTSVSTVTQWRDKSGNSRHAIPFQGQPFYSNTAFSNTQPGVVVWNSSTLYAPIPVNTFPSSGHFFVVFQKTSSAVGGAGDTIISRSLANKPAPFDTYNTSRYWGDGNIYANSNVSFDLSTASNINNWNFNITSNSWNEYLNGSTVALFTGLSGYGDNSSNLYFGSRQDTLTGSRAFIGEIIAYNKSLTTAERQQVEGYLAWKWGVQNNLLSVHPFRYGSTISLGPISTVNTL